MKKTIGIFLFLITAVFIISFIRDDKSSRNLRPEIENYKNLAFCSCLNLVYPSYDSVLNDGSASGFFQISDISLNDAEQLDSLAIKYARKEYLSATKSNLGVMRCLDFYNSEELDKVVREMLAD